MREKMTFIDTYNKNSYILQDRWKKQWLLDITIKLPQLITYTEQTILWRTSLVNVELTVGEM